MSWFRSYITSSVGAKHLVAITGFALSLFVLVHMAGNFLIYAGQDAMNNYAASLKGNLALLWTVRLGLLAMVGLHIGMALRLTVLNRAARPVKYARFQPIASRFYSRSMPWSGLALFAFIVYHLLHFTVHAIEHDYASMVDSLGRHDVYQMVVAGFQNPVIAGSYILAMAFLAMHLAHGVSSVFQSLGFNHPKYNPIFRNAGPVFAALIFIGNCSIPLSILTGIVVLPGA